MKNAVTRTANDFRRIRFVSRANETAYEVLACSSVYDTFEAMRRRRYGANAARSLRGSALCFETAAFYANGLFNRLGQVLSELEDCRHLVEAEVAFYRLADYCRDVLDPIGDAYDRDTPRNRGRRWTPRLFFCVDCGIAHVPQFWPRDPDWAELWLKEYDHLPSDDIDPAAEAAADGGDVYRRIAAAMSKAIGANA